MKTIFISIVSQDEEFLYQTVSTAIEQSSGKNQITFGILEQRVDDNFCDLSEFNNIIHQKITTTPRGVGVSRNECMNLYSDENYILITDSHMIFNKYWDQQLIRRIDYIEKNISSKAIISQHMPACVLNEDKMIPYVNMKKNISTSLYFDGIVLKDKKMISAIQKQFAVTCHFIFGRASNFISTPFDDRPYYLAEESIASLNFYNNGIEVFATEYTPMLHLAKPMLEIKNDWRSLADPVKMAEDFQIIVDTFIFKKNRNKRIINKDIIDKFIKDSGINATYVFKNFGFDNIGINEIEYIKNTIIENFKTNNFNDTVFNVVWNLASKN